MTNYNENNEAFSDEADDEGMNTMAVLSTLGGSASDGELAEADLLGLDASAGKAKLSSSSLAVGVVVVIGAATLLGMKLTLGAINGGPGPAEAIAEIDSFLVTQTAATQVGIDGPIKAPDAESTQVLEELKQNPTDHQVPPEDVETNPFDISDLVTRAATPTETDGGPIDDPREVAIARAKTAAGNLRVDGISGQIVFIDGKDYRIGDAIGDGTFELLSIDGLTCVICTKDEHRIPLRLRYR